MAKRLISLLTRRDACIPIWSVRQTDILVPMRVSAPSAPSFVFRPPLRCLSSSATEGGGPPSATNVPPQQPLPPSASFASANTSSSSSTSPPPPSSVTVSISNGQPQITVPLPSRNELCAFTLKPITHTVGDFLHMLRTEDAGIDRAVVRNADGVRIAATTSIQTLMRSPFELVVNDVPYAVCPPPQLSLDLTSDGLDVGGPGLGLGGQVDAEDLRRMSGGLRTAVCQMYEALHVDQYLAEQEQRLARELEQLREELAPLEEQKRLLAAQAERRANTLTWAGLGMMSVQFGILARLTWWEYSWDIMEPVTYFVTYGTAMACYAYFVLTKQDYLLPDVRDRQYLLSFHKRAKKEFWDVDKYNSLKDGIRTLERDIKRLREPLQVHVPPAPPPAPETSAASSAVKSIIGGARQLNMSNFKNMLKDKLS